MILGQDGCEAVVSVACNHCAALDVIGPFAMDGYQAGEYREDWLWIVCRECNRSSVYVETSDVAST